MTLRERKQLQSVHDCLAIPFAAVGSQSSTVAGIARFHADMHHALPRARELIRWIATGEPYEGAIKEELTILEAWFLDRKEHDWK